MTTCEHDMETGTVQENLRRKTNISRAVRSVCSRVSRRARGTLTVAAVCAGTALTVAGCGGGAASVIDPVAQAATTSTSTAGYRLKLAMSLTSPALPSPITAAGQGAFNVRDHSGSFSLDMNLGNSPQVVQALGGSTLHLEELIKGLTIYLKLPSSLTSRVPTFAGKPWIEVNLAKAAASQGIPGLSSLTSNPASNDPSQMLQFLRGASGKVTKLGTESVNGVQTTHYRAEVSLSRIPDAVPAASRQAAEQSVKALERIISLRELPIDVWVDGGHLVRRMRLAFTESVSGQSLTLTMLIDIPEYGPQPAVVAPPADQVADLSALTGAGG